MSAALSTVDIPKPPSVTLQAPGASLHVAQPSLQTCAVTAVTAAAPAISSSACLSPSAVSAVSAVLPATANSACTATDPGSFPIIRQQPGIVRRFTQFLPCFAADTASPSLSPSLASCDPSCLEGATSASALASVSVAYPAAVLSATTDHLAKMPAILSTSARTSYGFNVPQQQDQHQQHQQHDHQPLSMSPPSRPRPSPIAIAFKREQREQREQQQQQSPASASASPLSASPSFMSLAARVARMSGSFGGTSNGGGAVAYGISASPTTPPFSAGSIGSIGSLGSVTCTTPVSSGTTPPSAGFFSRQSIAATAASTARRASLAIGIIRTNPSAVATSLGTSLSSSLSILGSSFSHGIELDGRAHSISISFGAGKDLVVRLYELPLELRRMIFKYAGPLTQLLHGELVQPLSEPMFRVVVAEAFRLDRRAAAERLAQGAHCVVLSWELLFVHSVEMKQIARRFGRVPNAPSFSAMDLHGKHAALALARFADMLRAGPPQELLPTAHSLLLWVRRCVASLLPAIPTLPPLPPLSLSLLQLQLSAMAAPQLPPLAKTRMCADLLLAAAALGDVELTSALLPVVRVPSRDVYRLAALGGHSKIVALLYERCNGADGFGVCDAGAVLEGALCGSHTDIARFVRYRASQPSNTASTHALVPFNSTVRDTLSKAPSLETLWWLLEHDRSVWHTANSWRFHEIRSDAAIYGHLDLFIFLHENKIGQQLSPRAMDAVAANGHVHIVQYLITNKIASFTVEALNGAAARGHLEMLKLLHSLSVPCSPEAFTGAARNGHIEAFCWLWNTFPQHRPPVMLMRDAARNGHWPVIDFYVKSIPRSDLTPLLEAALAGGHLVLSESLTTRYRALPSPSMMVAAIKNGHVNCVRWLYDRFDSIFRHTMPSQITSDVVEAPMRDGNVDLVAFLVEACGAKLLAACDVAAQFGSFNVIKYLFERDPGRYWLDVGRTAKDSGHPEIDGWLREQVKMRRGSAAVAN